MRRASLSDRTNLYRKEYEGEAILWQQRSAAEDQRTSTYNGDIRETRTDQENKDPVRDSVLAMALGREQDTDWSYFLLRKHQKGNSWAVPLSS